MSEAPGTARNFGSEDSPELIADTMLLRAVGGVVTISFTANLRLTVERDVTRAIAGIDAQEVIVDFANLSVCSSGMFGALILLNRRVPRVRLRNTNAPIREALDVMQLTSRFEIEDAPEE